jgi:hypothetical protein
MILSNFSIHWNSISTINFTHHPEQADNALRCETKEEAEKIVKELNAAASRWFGDDDDVEDHIFEAFDRVGETDFDGWVIAYWVETYDIDDDDKMTINSGPTYLIRGFEFKAEV